jgi:uncharacterized membrane protein
VILELNHLYRFDTVSPAGKEPMRKNLEAIGLGGLAVLFWITYRALSGPERLPERIPTHFGLDGQPNAWGPPAMMWLLPTIAVAIYLAMAVAARFPGAFHYPVRVTEENRERLEALAQQMLAFLNVETVWLLVWIQWSILEAARQGRWSWSPALAPLFVLTIIATALGHIAAMVRAARPKA